MDSDTGAKARLARTAVALCLLFIPCGCAPPVSPLRPGEQTTAEQPQGSSTPASSSAAEPTAAPLPGPAGGGAPPVAEAPVIRWIPIGPAAPTDPPEGTLYELVRKRDCAGLRDTTLNTAFPAVWTAAQATCFALASEQPADWQQAVAALAGVPALPAGRCWEAAVTASVRQVVEFRTAHPGTPLTLATEGVGDDCPRRLTGLTVLDGAHAGASVPSGSSAGGTRVQLDGFLVNVDRILVDGVPVPADGPQFGPFEFTSPPAEGRTSVKVTVEANPPVSGEAVFVYDDSTPPQPTPTTTAPEVPTPGGPTPGGPPSTPPPGQP